MKELCLIGSILDLPDEWEFLPEVNTVLSVQSPEQAINIEEVNMARTYSGKNPPRDRGWKVKKLSKSL